MAGGGTFVSEGFVVGEIGDVVESVEAERWKCSVAVRCARVGVDSTFVAVVAASSVLPRAE